MNLRFSLLSALILILTTACNGTVPSSNAVRAQSDEPAPPIQPAILQSPSNKGYLPERLLIPAIDVDIPVVELGWNTSQSASGDIFSEWDVAEYAAGWHKNSALVDSTEINGGNVVMSGHNNILGSVFRELDQLSRGDAITIWSDNRIFDYAVEQVLIVPEKYANEEQRRANASWIGPFEDERLTLVSCWPRDDNTHRIIVVAHPKE